MTYLIASSDAESGTIETLPETEGLTIVNTNDLANSNWKFSTKDKVCITSEAAIEVVLDRLEEEAKINAIIALKDKYKFRQLLTKIYPNYIFKKVGLAEIAKLTIKEKSVIKPSKGCFGAAVKIIDANTDMKCLETEIKAELEKNGAVFSEVVLSKNEFLLESFIEGEEYAVGMFYDENGQPNITNIYYHPIPKQAAYLHMVYYTSRAIFQKLYDKAIQFFTQLNELLQVSNFMIHGEFKLHDDTLLPIEMNCMRYGGMGLGNLAYHAFGVNPYTCFIHNQAPNWEEIWQQQSDQNSLYAFFVAYNGQTIDKAMFKPNIAKLKEQFTKVILETSFDYKKQLAFGTFYLKETPANLERLLGIEFDDYFEAI